MEQKIKTDYNVIPSCSNADARKEVIAIIDQVNYLVKDRASKYLDDEQPDDLIGRVCYNAQKKRNELEITRISKQVIDEAGIVNVQLDLLMTQQKRELCSAVVRVIFDMLQDRTFLFTVLGKDYSARVCDFSYYLRMKETFRSVGHCDYGKRELAFSTSYCTPRLLDPFRCDLVIDLILHEFAHAFSFHKLGHSGHGYKWKAIADQIGAEPTSTTSN
jgi:hypothetical protein